MRYTAVVDFVVDGDTDSVDNVTSQFAQYVASIPGADGIDDFEVRQLHGPGGGHPEIVLYGDEPSMRAFLAAYDPDHGSFDSFESWVGIA